MTGGRSLRQLRRLTDDKTGVRGTKVSDSVTIALDAMGGDHAPRMVVKGADIALQRHPDTRFLLFGAEEKVRPLLAKRPRLASAVTLHHTDEVVADDARPSLALRTGRQSSMRLAIDSVADGRADGVVSAGNTGALMAIAKFVLKMLPGIDRPAIASFFPTRRGESVMLDLGANVECDEENRSEEHTSELQSRFDLVCRLLLEKKKNRK